MQLIKATMLVHRHGAAEVHLPHWSGIEQQHGFAHGGVVGMIADSAAGYAAMTVVPAGASVLSVEYKLNFMAPGVGEMLIARGEVVRQGKTLSVSRAEGLLMNHGHNKLRTLM